MSAHGRKPVLGTFIYFSLMFLAAAYFTFAAVQGDQGLFRRVQIEAERDVLKADLATLESAVARMENKTRRLSDEYLDLDLLDEQARSVLGMIRSDEIVIR